MKNKLKEPGADRELRYGCLMVNFDIPDWNKYIRNLIKNEDIYDAAGYSYEDNCHATVLYGIHDGVNHEQIMQYLMPSHFIKVQFDDVSVFEGKEYDVVKFGCSSKALNSLNNTVRHYFEYTSDYPNYHPHVTIGYVKPGRGKKYVKKLPTPFILVPSGYLYSYPTGEKFQFDIEPIEGYEDNIPVA